MKRLTILLVAVPVLVLACGGQESAPEDTAGGAAVGVTVEYTTPEPLPVPEPKTPKSETDWEARAHNKEIEIIQVLNIINPIAAYISAAFEQYGDQIENPTVHEEWKDTQAQLQQALALYEDCKKRKAAGRFNKKLFLDLENTWQLLVKTGVAGVRTKQMVDAELQKLKS